MEKNALLMKIIAQTKNFMNVTMLNVVVHKMRVGQIVIQIYVITIRMEKILMMYVYVPTDIHYNSMKNKNKLNVYQPNQVQ